MGTEATKGEQLLCIDISGILVRPEPMGRGWEARCEGERRDHARGDTQDEAVGSLIRRLALEHEGANWRRGQPKAWVVSWFSSLTGAAGEGDTRFDFGECAACCASADTRFPGISHAPKFVGTAAS